MIEDEHRMWAPRFLGSVVIEPLLDGTGFSVSGLIGSLFFVVTAVYGMTVFVAQRKQRRESLLRDQRKALEAAAARPPRDPILAGKEPLTTKKCRRRVVWRALLAVAAAVLTFFVVKSQVVVSRGPTVEATILTRQDVTSEVFLYEARIDNGSRTGQVYRFDASSEAAPGERVTLRWVALPQGLEFASTAVTAPIFVASLGGAITAMFVFGVFCAISDHRRLASPNA
jgi:Ca2+/Na+ antiporter